MCSAALQPPAPPSLSAQTHRRWLYGARLAMGHGEYPRVTKVFVMAVRGMDLYAAWLKYRRRSRRSTRRRARLNELSERESECWRCCCVDRGGRCASLRACGGSPTTRVAQEGRGSVPQPQAVDGSGGGLTHGPDGCCNVKGIDVGNLSFIKTHHSVYRFQLHETRVSGFLGDE